MSEPVVEQLVKRFAKLIEDEAEKFPNHSIREIAEPKLRAFTVHLVSILMKTEEP